MIIKIFEAAKIDSEACDTQMCKRTQIAVFVLEYFEMTVRMLFTMTVAILIFKRKQFHSMTWLAKLSFIGMIVMAFFDIVITIGYLQFEKNWINELEMAIKFIFMENHWLFAAHYLRVACLFRLLFARHSESDLRLMQRRNRWLRIIFFVFSAFIAGGNFGFYYFHLDRW